MRLSVPGVRVADVESCDFAMIPSMDTRSLLRAARPEDWERYLESPVSRRLLAELGVERRYMTHVPGRLPDPARLTALDLGISAVERLRARRPDLLAHLDAIVFVSTSNPSPCNCQASLLAERLGLAASCYDIKAGCSSGVLGIAQAALLVAAGCERVLVVMAENLSQLMPADDLRALLTVGDGAACAVVERHEGPGFVSVLHETDSRFAGTMAVRAPFPPAVPDARYVYEFADTQAVRDALHERWRDVFGESMRAAGMRPGDLAHAFLHQTHAAQVDDLVRDVGLDPARVVRVVHEHGNMGSPTFAVAMSRAFARIEPGQRFLMQAVGGGLSSCAIVAEHR